jgi:hypothetical protein
MKVSSRSKTRVFLASLSRFAAFYRESPLAAGWFWSKQVKSQISFHSRNNIIPMRDDLAILLSGEHSDSSY